MKKAFTLVEMLIVVVVLVTLMTMVFRIGSIGGSSKARNVTVARIQRLENALSGYYAAFGTYPPVKPHGERNPYIAVDARGLQDENGQMNENIWGWISGDGLTVRNGRDEQQAWRQVQAACRCQPVDCQFPFPEDMGDLVAAAAEELKMMAEDSQTMDEDTKRVCAAGFDDGVTQNIGRHSGNRGESDWRDVQLFKFGLLSFLLPRYLVMMNGDESFFEDFAQWTNNNDRPSDPFTGQKFTSWGQIQDYAQGERSSDLARVANIPSQAVCARWMANFEGLLSCNYDLTLFGVNVQGLGQGQTNGSLPTWDEESGTLSGGEILSPDRSTSGQYVLDQVTLRDGWGRDLYYYSPPPHQSYIVWSSGANGRTFPPWIAREGLSGEAKKCVAYWTKDDIAGLGK